MHFVYFWMKGLFGIGDKIKQREKSIKELNNSMSDTSLMTRVEIHKKSERR